MSEVQLPGDQIPFDSSLSLKFGPGIAVKDKAVIFCKAGSLRNVNDFTWLDYHCKRVRIIYVHSQDFKSESGLMKRSFLLVG